MGILHTVRLASAGAITLPKAGLWLLYVRTIAAVSSTPGDFALIYDGASTARFASLGSTSGYIGYMEHFVNWQVNTASYQASSVLFEGGIGAVELIFSDQPIPVSGRQPLGGPAMQNAGPAAIQAFRASRIARTDGMAVTANITLTYDVQPNVPREAMVLTSAATQGRVLYPATGGYLSQVEAIPSPFPPSRIPAPTLPATNTVVFSVITDAACTIQALVYY